MPVQKSSLLKLQTSILTRLQGDYYRTEQQKILTDYQKKFSEDPLEAFEYLQFALCMLRKQQRHDVITLCELTLIEHGVLAPGKIEVQYDHEIDA